MKTNSFIQYVVGLFILSLSLGLNAQSENDNSPFTIDLSFPLPEKVDDITASAKQKQNLSWNLTKEECVKMQEKTSLKRICHKDHIIELLKTSDAEGIRIYPANIGTTSNPVPSILAIAIDSTGDDLLPSNIRKDTPCYIFQRDGSVKKVTVESAINMINNIRSSFSKGTVFEPLMTSFKDQENRTYFKAAFTGTDLKRMLSVEGAKSLRFDIVQIKESDSEEILRTFAVSPVDDDGAIIGTNTKLSLLPCPRYCRDGYID
ncbi:MAG: hypothetical protein AAF849_20000 [Bacteroidota bacterium]